MKFAFRLYLNICTSVDVMSHVECQTKDNFPFFYDETIIVSYHFSVAGTKFPILLSLKTSSSYSCCYFPLGSGIGNNYH